MYVRLADQNVLQPTSVPSHAVARSRQVRLGALSMDNVPWGLVIGGGILVAFLGGAIYLSRK